MKNNATYSHKSSCIIKLSAPIADMGLVSHNNRRVIAAIKAVFLYVKTHSILPIMVGLCGAIARLASPVTGRPTSHIPQPPKIGLKSGWFYLYLTGKPHASK